MIVPKHIHFGYDKYTKHYMMKILIRCKDDSIVVGADYEDGIKAGLNTVDGSNYAFEKLLHRFWRYIGAA